MKFKHLFALTLASVVAVSAMADEAFRLHRYDSFKGTPTEPGQIVFVGNSITNMGSWMEFFGSDAKVINRGNSGGYSWEILANLENYIDCRPSKFFLMIGTNDIATGFTPETIAKNIRTIVTRVKEGSPDTEIYVQSILPSTSGVRTTTTLNSINVLIKAVCQEENVTYVDLWDSLMCMVTGGTAYSYDALHPNGAGYRIWVNQIYNMVNGQNSILQNISNNTGTLGANSNGAKVSEFGMLPVKSTDVLILGDELINGGEWHELLRSDRIKARGIAWGYGGVTLAQAKSMVTVSLGNNSSQQDPAKIFIYTGLTECNNGTAAAILKTGYQDIVNEVHNQAPGTKVYIMSMIPHSNSTNNSRAIAFNNALKEIAAADDLVTYVDIFTPLANADNTPNSKYITNNYLYGLGYVRVANVLAQYMQEDGVRAWTEAEAEVRYAARTALNNAANLEFGPNPGQYPLENRDAITSKMQALRDAIYAGSGVEAATAALNAAVTELQQSGEVNTIQVSTDTETHWYRLTSVRSSASIKVVNNVINGVSTEDNSGAGVWKFVSRGDDTYDIVNYDGYYIVPNSGSTSASVEASTTRPTTMGWKIANSNYAFGTFVIYGESGTVRYQLNQSNRSSDIWNWYDTTADFPTRSDEGSSYYIVPFEGRIIDQAQATGWYEISVAGGTLASYVVAGTNQVVNADDEFRQNATNSYALAFATKLTEKPAKAFVHITVNGNTWQFTGLNGHGIQENCTSSRESLPAENPEITANSDGTFVIGKWSNYENSGPESPYVGKASASSNYYNVTPVDEDILAGYDIWTVTISGIANASEVIYDTRITLDIPANKGIKSVYNGGTYFLAKGTAISANDIVVNIGTGVTTSVTEPTISINQGAKTISVAFDRDPNAPADYCYPTAAISRTDRQVTGFTVADNEGSTVAVGALTPANGNPIYVDNTATVLETKAGNTITFTLTNAAGEWMHSYMYIDFGKDGVFDVDASIAAANGDLVGFDRYSPAGTYYDSAGNTYSDGHTYLANRPSFSFTLPSDLATGDYRARYKCDWNSTDPCGTASIADNGGAVVDFTIHVQNDNQGTSIENAVIDPANGPIEYYNLQGARVSGNNLVPGFYIVRQGSVAKKVFIGR